MNLVDIEVPGDGTLLVLRRPDGTCTVSLPRDAIDRALAVAGADRLHTSEHPNWAKFEEIH
jgi:hypothetical protein